MRQALCSNFRNITSFNSTAQWGKFDNYSILLMMSFRKLKTICKINICKGMFHLHQRGKRRGESQQKPGSSKIKTVNCTWASLLHLGEQWASECPGAQGVNGKSLSFNLEFPGFCHCILPIVDLGYNPILIKLWALISFVLLSSVLLFFTLKK